MTGLSLLLAVLLSATDVLGRKSRWRTRVVHHAAVRLSTRLAGSLAGYCGYGPNRLAGDAERFKGTGA